MIDSHFHLWTEDTTTPDKRADRADQVRGEMAKQGVDRICLIGEVGQTIEACYEANRTVAKFQAEHPDIFYGWARVDPRLGEEAVEEFKRAVQEDGLIGLKHHFIGTPVNIADPEFFPLVEAAIEMDVPIIAHVMERHSDDKHRWDETEAYSEDVAALAERYPELTLISGHIGAGGFWEKRIKTIESYDNVYLDTSGSNTETDVLEMAAERLGVDRLVYGTDTWLLPGVGKLEGAELTPEEKAEIAYNMERLIPTSTPNKLSEAELEDRIERSVEHFRERAKPREETIVDANAYVGNWAFRDVDATPDDLVSMMDRKGVDKAVVSSLESAMYRNVHAGNRRLHEALEESGHRDRLIPFATINPTYPGWEADLEECVEEFGMQGVRLLPLYHDYDIHDPAVTALMDKCVDLDVPLMFIATLEDQRGRHPRVNLRDFEGNAKHWGESHGDAIVSQLKKSPETDVIIANGWAIAERVKRETTESYPNGVRMNNQVRSGETVFVLDDLFMHFAYQGENIVETIGVDRLVTGPKMPLLVFDAHYKYTENLPVEDEERERVASGTILSLLE